MIACSVFLDRVGRQRLHCTGAWEGREEDALGFKYFRGILSKRRKFIGIGLTKVMGMQEMTRKAVLGSMYSIQSMMHLCYLTIAHSSQPQC